MDASISSTIDLTIDGGLETVFGGTKTKSDALVGFGIGIGTGILGNLIESKVFNANESRAFLKSLKPTLQKVIVETVKALESGGTSAEGNKIKENLNEKTDL